MNGREEHKESTEAPIDGNLEEVSLAPSLLDILKDKINEYLTADNVGQDNTNTYRDDKLEATFQAVSSFFAGRGPIGRERAISYRDRYLPDYERENNLYTNVYRDVTSPNGILGTSKQLRRRLLEGLCQYYGMDSEYVNTRIKAYHQMYARAQVPTMSVRYLGSDLERTIMLTFLKQRQQVPVEMKLQGSDPLPQSPMTNR